MQNFERKFCTFVLKRIYFVFLFLVFLLSINNYLSSEELKHKTAEQYYLDGIYSYVDRSYTTSAEQFEALSKNYPYSRYTRNSLIMEVFINYINREYEKIESIFAVFSKLFPNDEYMPYMLYMLGMSYYINIRGDDKGSGNIAESLSIFTDFLKKYPESKYSENVKEKISYLKKMQQLNDVKIGEFYQKNNNYISAMRRYVGIFERYKNDINSEVEERALCGIVTTSYALSMCENMEKYKQLLERKFPKSKCLKSKYILDVSCG